MKKLNTLSKRQRLKQLEKEVRGIQRSIARSCEIIASAIGGDAPTLYIDVMIAHIEHLRGLDDPERLEIAKRAFGIVHEIRLD